MLVFTLNAYKNGMITKFSLFLIYKLSYIAKFCLLVYEDIYIYSVYPKQTFDILVAVCNERLK